MTFISSSAYCGCKAGAPRRPMPGNAIKRGLEEGKPGRIRVTLGWKSGRNVVVTVNDDGLPLPSSTTCGDGPGLGLAKRLMASIGGRFVAPGPGLKTFELRVPLAGA